ncbi:hypothetical protein [Streptomyces chrestomyceticus]|uniref:hypothetical protein n=1 Tax=Streptomyces chrestomyceticus TaxID=68185 RepID=UPI0019D194D2|nr:hypothetical protein [Streptomyces chrestomyceticus]
MTPHPEPGRHGHGAVGATSSPSLPRLEADLLPHGGSHLGVYGIDVDRVVEIGRGSGCSEHRFVQMALDGLRVTAHPAQPARLRRPALPARPGPAGLLGGLRLGLGSRCSGTCCRIWGTASGTSART